MAWKEIAVTIEGTSPLQMNRFTDQAKRGVNKGTSPVTSKKDIDGYDAAHAHGHWDDKDHPVLPVMNLFNCLIEAGTKIKLGKSKLTTQKSSQLPGMLRLIGTAFPIIERIENGNSHRGKHDPARWRPVEFYPANAKGERVLCWRPVFDAWLIPFTMVIDDEYISVDTARELVDIAGRWIGLGTMRINHKGIYGAFVVSQWEPK
jgi:hypothetical protein